MRVAAIQMASGSIIKGNLIEAEKLIQSAVADGAEMVVLPENFGLIGVHAEDVVQNREQPGSGPLQDFLSQQAAKHQIILVGGTIPLVASDNQHYLNTLMVHNQQGENIARYDKIHLFDVHVPENDEQYNESAVIEAGNEVSVIDIGPFKLGLAICYDLRFPELFRELVNKGAEVIVIPSAFTAATGKAHWHTLVKARAIENLSYVVASAQGGFHVNGRETYGHSLIVDCWGNILDEKDSGSGYAIADLDIAQQKKIRDGFPVLNHRRLYCSTQ